MVLKSNQIKSNQTHVEADDAEAQMGRIFFCLLSLGIRPPFHVLWCLEDVFLLEWFVIFSVFKIVKPLIRMRFRFMTQSIFGSSKCDLLLCCKLANRLLEWLIWQSHKYWNYWTDMVLASQTQSFVTSCEGGKIVRQKSLKCVCFLSMRGGGHLCWVMTSGIIYMRYIIYIWQFHLSPMFTSSFPFSPSTGGEHSFSPSRPSWKFTNDNKHSLIIIREVLLLIL